MVYKRPKVTKWFKHGDHPRVKEIEGVPGNTICGLCGQTMSVHGMYSHNKLYQVVCPGDNVIEDQEDPTLLREKIEKEKDDYTRGTLI